MSYTSLKFLKNDKQENETVANKDEPEGADSEKKESFESLMARVDAIRNTGTWTGKSLEQNVRMIDDAYAPTCNEKRFYEYLYCQVYRKGSQATHSSFGGLAKSVEINKVIIDDAPLLKFKASQPQLIFSCFHSLIVFLSSARFLASIVDREDVEEYYQDITRYIISEK